MTSHSFGIPAMSSRRCVRVISACVSDVPGVRTVEARLDTKTVRVTGTADPTTVQTAIRDAGYDVIPLTDTPEKTCHPHRGDPRV